MGSFNEPSLDNWWEQPASEPQGSVTVTGAPADAGGGGGGGDINQIYEQYLGRGVDPSGAQTYAGWAPQDIINAIQGSPEYANYTAGGGGGGNLPSGPYTNYGGNDVNALYQQYLGRDVDPSGAATWAGKSMDEIVAGITGSQEYANRGGSPAGSAGGAPTTLDYGSMTPEQTVNDIYKKVLGREADAGAAGWIEDVRGGTSALELAQRLQATDEGKAYMAAHPEEAYKVMAGLSQENAPFKKEGEQFGYYTPTYGSEGDITGKQFNPTIDYSQLKYSGTTQVPIGGEGSTATTHQYEDNKGGTITVDDRGNMISYTPSTTWYAEQAAKHPDAMRKGYRNIDYMAAGPIDQTINIMGQEVPVNAQEYMTNEKGQLIVDKAGNLIPMVRQPDSGGGFQNFIDKAVDMGIMAVGTLGGGPIGAAGAATLVGLKNETPTNQILRNAALAAGTTYVAGQFLPNSSVPVDEITSSTFSSPAFQLGAEGANAANATLASAPTWTAPALSAASTVAPTAASTATSSTPAWLQAAEKGAIVGGTMGGINAVVQGQDPLKGIGYGALTGAVGGGAGSYFGSAINPFAGNVLGGALAGTAGAAVTGQDLTRGALYGGGSGALNYGLTQSEYAPEYLRNNPYARGAVSGAAFSTLAGGDPLRGAISGAAGSYFGNQLNNYANDIYNRNFNMPAPDRFPVTEGEWNGPDAKVNLAPRADVNIPSDIRFADNAPLSTEKMRGVDTNAPLARLATYNPSNDLPLPDFEDTFPVDPNETYRPADSMQAGEVKTFSGNPDNYIIKNEDGSITAVTPEGSTTIPPELANQLVATLDMANNDFARANQPIDYSQGDVFIPEPYGGEYSKFAGAVQPIPSDMAGYEAPSMTNPLVNIGNQGAFAREPFMTEIAERQGSVSVQPYIEKDIAAPLQSTSPVVQPQDLPSIDDQDLAIMASEMSAPTEPQEALAISESAVVEANATPQEQEVISQLKDIITSPDTTAEEKQAAAEELKQISVEIATKGADTGSEQGALSGVVGGAKDGSDTGVQGGVQGGVDGGVLGGIIGGRGLQPGTGGGYFGEDPNPGEDKIDMEEEPEQEPEEEVPVEEVPFDEFPTEDDTSTDDESSGKKPSLPRQPVPIKKPIYGSGIPGYSWNENITGALPHNLTATMLAGAPTQEGRRMLQQLKQLYPQLSTIDPHLLQTLSSRAGSTGGSGGGALSTPAPGYPDQAAGKTTFAQSSMPANFNALSASGLQSLGGAAGSNIAGYAAGGDVHVPEFKTGTTGHYVQGRGDGQSDEIPAMLANGEYVFDADTVAALGNGSNEAGARALDKMREAIRKHKRSAPHTKIPPKAKSPLEYLKGK